MIREEIIAKNLVPSVETMEYYNKTNSISILNTPQLGLGLSFAITSNQLYFSTKDMLEEFERRVNHHRLRSEMKVVWNSLDNMKKSLIMNDLKPILMQNVCAPCENDQFYDCRHLPYEAVVKMHHIVCGTEEIIAKNLVPSVETMEYYNKTMSMALRPYLLHELSYEIRSGGVYFYSKDMLEEFERRVNHLRLRAEMKVVWNTTAAKDILIMNDLRPLLMQNPCDQCANDDFYDCRHLPYEAVVKMHDIVCGKEDVPPPIVYPLQHHDEYIERATSLLHDVATLASQHKSMAEVLIGSSLSVFATRLVKRNVEDLKTLENYIRIALDPKNPFSLLFEKFDHLTSAQKEIVCGILDIKSGAEPAACRMADALARLEAGGLEKQMLMEFMKKIKI